MGDNDVTEDVIWLAYRENLEAVLPHVERFMATVGGKTVVTADHGEMINDRASPLPHRVYGHPGGLYTPELLDVPWHTYTNGERRDVIADEPVEAQEPVDSKVIDDRLSALGYG